MLDALETEIPIAGHVVVMRLLKRFRLVNTLLDPATIEASWEDQHGAAWAQAAQAALGRCPSLREATRRDLWAVCKVLVGWLGQRTPRCNHYPQGWQEAVALVQGAGRRKTKARDRASEDEREDALETLRYLASLRGRDVEGMLAELGTTGRTITREHRDRALGLWGVAGSEARF